MKTYCRPFKRGVSWRSQNFGANATIYGPHTGTDDAANIGTPVHAAGDGFIEWAGEFDDTYHDNLLWLLRMGGNIAVLNCGDAEPTFVYGHLHSFAVKRGDWVRKGQVIAYSGNTGFATTGAHLHTEAVPPGYVLAGVHLGRVNPDIYLTEWPEDLQAITYQSTPEQPKEWDEMASREDLKAALREVLTEAPVLDTIALAVLKRPCHLVNPVTGKIEGTTTLATKINWQAFNFAQLGNAIAAVGGEVVEVSDLIKTTHIDVPDGGVPVGPSLLVPVEEPAAEKAAE